jgi:diguanylate cyclase (GGDEF)-like protein
VHLGRPAGTQGNVTSAQFARPWLAAVSAVAGVAMISFATGQPLRGVLLAAAAMVPPVLVLVGVHVHRPQRANAWQSMAIGLALLAVSVLPGLPNTPGGTVLPLAFIPLAGFLLTATSIVRIIRDETVEGSLSAILDALIVAVGAAFIGWFAAIQRHLETTGGGSFPDAVLAVIYPSVDVALLFMAIRTTWRHRGSTPAVWLLGAAVGTALVAHAGVLLGKTAVGYDPGQLTDLGAFIAGALFAAAALHPSMSAPLGAPRRPAGHGVTGVRMAAVAVGIFIAPLVLLAYALLGPNGPDITLSPRAGLPPIAVEIALGSLLVAGLVTARLTTSLIRLERTLGARERLEGELTRQAESDSLTALPNRSAFVGRLQRTLSHERPVGAVLFCDLDDFKSVNDTEGHAAGDELLRTVAARIHGCVRPSDLAARLGGDEFAVLLEGVTDPLIAARAAERIIAAFDRPIELGGRQFTVGISIGIAMVTGGVEAAELMRQADIAMYLAKSQGKGRCERFEPRMESGIVNRMALRADLERALAEHEFFLVYQPIQHLDGQVIAAVEALVRWNHPERGVVPPSEFISLAEQTGLIVPLGQWVLETACAQMRGWLDAGARADARISINVSPIQLAHPGFVDRVRAALAETRLPAANVVLEITESALVEFDSALGVLDELRRLGLQIALDDFGTGYSAMSYLARFPIDILKIDRSFVSAMSHDPQSASLVRTIIGLAQNLQLTTVAEGIEEDAQLLELQRLGCPFGQGFMLHRPLMAEIAGPLLVANSRARLAA